MAFRVVKNWNKNEFYMLRNNGTLFVVNNNKMFRFYQASIVKFVPWLESLKTLSIFTNKSSINFQAIELNFNKKTAYFSEILIFSFGAQKVSLNK
jgi:hypothetical protein